MKLLALIVVPILALLAGGWWWLAQDGESEPSVFANQPLTLPEGVSPAVPVAEAEPLPSAAPVVELAPPTPEGAPTPTPTPVPSEVATVLSTVDRLISFGFRTVATQRSIDTVVLHSSYNASGGDAYNLDKIIGQYEQYGVGAHYLIDRSGTVYRLVREGDIAYHAGESKMPDGRKNVNDFSIGIELMGTEESGFSAKQYDAVNALIADIKTRHSIKEVVGHSDIAPSRKTDPWKFDWKKLK